MTTIVKAAGTYFGLVFGFGFILGPIRILFIVPRFGVRIAELMEAPIMLMVIVFAAKCVVHRFNLARAALPVGLIALGFMLVFEFTVVITMRGITLAEYFHERDPVSGTVYYLLLVVFAIMPLLFSARRPVSGLRNEAQRGS